jgi:hypothetical protein
MKKVCKLILCALIILFSSFQILPAQTIIAPRKQLVNGMYASANPVVPIRKICSGKVIHRFHDTSPLSPSGRYVALFRVPFEDHYPGPGDAGEVVLTDLETLKERVLARSCGWELQVGANVQWGATDHELFYNDVDPHTWKAFAVRLDPFSEKSERMNGTVFMVTADGKKLVSHNLVNSVHAQSGYGVIIPDSLTQYHVGAVKNDGIFVTDTETGKSKRIVTIREIYEKTTPSVRIPNPEDYAFYCFKAMWNPQGTRIMTCLMWKPMKGGRRNVAVITMRANNGDIRTAITAEQYGKGGHHMAWLPDGEHISMNLQNDDDPELELITVKYDGTGLKTVFPTGSGHPSFHPKGLPYVITDSYWNEPVANQDGFIPLRLLNIETGREIEIARVFVPQVEDNAFRIDLHPAWDRSGRYVIFNGYEDNERCVFMADLEKILNSPACSSSGNTTGNSGRPVLSVWNYDHMLEVCESLKRGENTYQIPYRNLLREAEKILGQRPISVMDKPDEKVAKSGDKHDFISVGKYCWPNPDTPDGMPWIQRDGYINVENFKQDDAVRLDNMCHNVTRLSLAYFFSSDDRFAKKAVEMARVWFIDPATRMNPHLIYGQVIPGVDNGMGHYPGIIFGRVYINLLAGLCLIKNSPAYTPEFDSGIKKWFSAYTTWLKTSDFGIKESKTTSNHSIAYDQQLLAFALFSGDDSTARKIVSDFHPVRIFQQVQPDGKMPRELARTLGLGYSAFNVIHMLEICEMAAQINPSLYEVTSSDGRCIGKAIDYIAQFPGKTVEDFAPYQQIADWDNSIRQICWILKWADKYDPSKKYGDIFKRNAELLADDINNLLY